MPIKTGVEALRELRQQGIDTKAILLSGLLNEAREESQDISNLSYLQKLYSLLQLQETIRNTYPEYFETSAQKQMLNNFTPKTSV